MPHRSGTVDAMAGGSQRRTRVGYTFMRRHQRRVGRCKRRSWLLEQWAVRHPCAEETAIEEAIGALANHAAVMVGFVKLVGGCVDGQHGATQPYT